MKQIHILLALGLILLLTARCSNPYFNEDGLKSLLKEKTGIIVEDSLTIINFEWSAAIGRDYFEEYTLKCSPKDHKNILNHARQNGWEYGKGWESVNDGYSFVIPQISFSDTTFIFDVFINKQEMRISIVEE
jgi:hypothetical protein